MNKRFWYNKNVLITGGSGFLGSHLITSLSKKGAKIYAPTHHQFDLRDKKACQAVVKGQEIIIHLAAKVGGIGFNLLHPGEMFYDNIMMGVNLMEEARIAGAKKFVALGTICAYPKLTPVPFKEKDLWSGYPEETNAPYGLAKKMLLVQSQAYRKQYGFNAIYLLPVNMYGPGDKFDSSVSHVIPALIHKIIKAKENNHPYIIAWGTGLATREFLYVDDAVRGIILATEKYNKSEPVNLGSGQEISIQELAEMICKLLHYKGIIKWDRSKPDGQPRRRLDTTFAYNEFGFKAKTDFKTGLQKTIQYYIKMLHTHA